MAVRYRSFFLNPGMPPEGLAFRPYMEAKGAGRMPVEGFFDGPRRAGAAVGLAFNFESITRAPNTLLSHRLLALTPEAQHPAMVRALYAAYFEFGLDLGDLDTLVRIATQVGLDPEALRRALQTDAGRAEVLADVEWSRQLGVTGVPFFLFDGKFWLTGAQPPEMLLKAFEHVTRQPR